MQRKQYKSNLMSKDKRQKTNTTQPIDWEQAQSVLKLLKFDEKFNTLLMFAFGFYFGLRISDILNITWNQVMKFISSDYEIQVIDELKVKEIKTGKFRIIQIQDEVKRFIKLSYEMMALQPPISQHIFIYNRSFLHNMTHVVNVPLLILFIMV